MTSLDELDDLWPPPDPAVMEREPRKCLHPRYLRTSWTNGIGGRGWTCERCGHVVEAATARRGKQSRNYGNRAELAVARKYGGTKIGHAGGPVDVRGVDFNVQVKTHRRLPPAEWRKAFGGMNASLERIPRLLLRFLPGPGLPPDDYFVMRADDWLRWFGKDEDLAAVRGGE